MTVLKPSKGNSEVSTPIIHSEASFYFAMFVSLLLATLDWLLQVKNSDEKLSRFTEKQFLSGRKKVTAFHVMLDRFVPCIVGKTVFKERLKSAKVEEDVYTICDETFCLLVIENYYDRWVDMFENGQTNSSTKPKSKEWQWRSDVKTKYTEGGIRFREPEQEQANEPKEDENNEEEVKGVQSKGWSDAGIQRHNALFQIVKQDRSKRPKPFRRWLKEKQDELQSQERAKPRPTIPATFLPITTEIFEKLLPGEDAIGEQEEQASDQGEEVLLPDTDDEEQQDDEGNGTEEGEEDEVESSDNASEA
jgi:hypothetical protein